ncbi:hypothetical protein [Gemmatimonas groenlandica]|uniref:hypothetical protein n=1 Tax=Gemmatimonas groenlandica TaxID=2732249 RepID=UPI00197F8B47|nr:hypothetical protein [Gemmatimonas groenlandica]
MKFLGAHVAAFDVIIAADTICYVGELDAFAHAARRSLADDGLLIFTVEVLTDGAADAPWRLQPHGRYCHAREYVETTLADHGFSVRDVRRVVLRREAGRQVDGWLVTAAAS